MVDVIGLLLSNRVSKKKYYYQMSLSKRMVTLRNKSGKSSLRNFVLFQREIRTTLVLICFGIFCFSFQPGKKTKPHDLNEALTLLDQMLSDSSKNEIKKLKERDFVVNAHFGLGRELRNKWSLWKRKPLSKYFNSIGVYHPDDMSAIILTSYYRQLNGLPVNLEQQIMIIKSFHERI